MTTPARKPKVLVVDDDHEFACDVKMWLTKEGFCTQVVEVGQAAIQRYRLYRPYAAVVLDMHMPKVDGMQVLREIKKTDGVKQMGVEISGVIKLNAKQKNTALIIKMIKTVMI